jgi:large subunit ribosomal protein L32e
MAKIKIVKKKTNTFDRFECDRHTRMGRSWRRPRGIDCRVRRRYRGVLRMPKIGYGSNYKTRHLLPSYKKKFVVHNVQELDLLLMNNDKYTAEISATVGAIKRIQILRRADELNVKVTNRKSRKITKYEKKAKKQK